LSKENKKKANEQYLISWRRKQVAERMYEGEDVKTIADALKVSTRTIYDDEEYIENHSNEIMKNYLVKTVPNIINKSIHQISLANHEAIKILKDKASNRKEKLSAALTVSKTARDVVDIVAGNKGVVEAALELDESLKQEKEEQDELLSGDSAETETSAEDQNAKF
jgi:hypothetical protein